MSWQHGGRYDQRPQPVQAANRHHQQQKTQMHSLSSTYPAGQSQPSGQPHGGGYGGTSGQVGNEWRTLDFENMQIQRRTTGCGPRKKKVRILNEDQISINTALGQMHQLQNLLNLQKYGYNWEKLFKDVSNKLSQDNKKGAIDLKEDEWRKLTYNYKDFRVYLEDNEKNQMRYKQNEEQEKILARQNEDYARRIQQLEYQLQQSNVARSKSEMDKEKNQMRYKQNEELEKNLARQNEDYARRIQQLEDQLQHSNEARRKSEDQVARLQEELKIHSAPLEYQVDGGEKIQKRQTVHVLSYAGQPNAGQPYATPATEQMQITKMKEELNEKQRIETQLKGQISDYEKQIAQLKGEIFDYEKQTVQLKRQISDSEKQVAQLKGQIFDYEKQIAQLKGQISSYEKQNAQLQGELSKAQVQTTSLQQQEARHSTAQVDKQQQEIDKLRQKVEDTKTEYEAKIAKYKEESKGKKNKIKIHDLEKENKELKEALNVLNVQTQLDKYEVQQTSTTDSKMTQQSSIQQWSVRKAETLTPVQDPATSLPTSPPGGMSITQMNASVPHMRPPTLKPGSLHTARLRSTLLIPDKLFGDGNMMSVIRQLVTKHVESANLSVNLQAWSGDELRGSLERVLVPCITTSRVGSDLQAAFSQAHVPGNVCVLVIIFHHLARHNCSITTATSDRLQDRGLVARCEAIIDAVFWNGEVYQCPANGKAGIQLQTILAKERELERVQESTMMITTNLRASTDGMLESKTSAGGYSVTIPQELYNDRRIQPIVEQLLQWLAKAGCHVNLVKVSGKALQGGKRVLLPCIAASRVGSDLQAAIETAQVKYSVKLVVCIFHHLASHDCKIRTPTRDRLQDRSVVDRSHAIIDLVFWNGQMYDCEANNIAISQLTNIVPHM